jgi:transcriptional regulator with XRE-family HTH domain
VIACKLNYRGKQMRFGPYIRELRKDRRLGLREFCKALAMDPSNWSKVERGVLHPPTEEEKITEISSLLGISKGDDEWHNMIDYASLDRGEVPKDILSDEEVLDKLPAFFRTMRGQKPDEKELRRLIELIKKNG